jgi:cytidine deaminase
VTDVDWDALTRTAWRAREEAYAPYSHYRVGAALLAEDGRVFAGANVENASYGLCLCAERAAVGAAVTAGARRFAAIVVVTGGDAPGSPCGMCRQVMCEFAPSFPVRCIAESGASLDSTTDALLPHAFTPASLGVEIEGMRSTLLLGSANERSDTDRPPPDPRAGAAFVGVALKVAAGTGADLAAAALTHTDDEER